MNKNYTYSALLLLLAVSGCASLSPEQCAHADWRQIGYADGVQGISGAQINEHARACAPQGIRPNLDLYLAGRTQGLVSYCQAGNGFNLGRRGVTINSGDCPENLKWNFLDQYKQGSQIYTIESELESRRNQLREHQNNIHTNEKQIGEIKAELRRKDLSNDRRNALLDELNRRIDRKEDLIHDALEREVQIDHVQHRLYQKLRELGR